MQSSTNWEKTIPHNKWEIFKAPSCDWTAEKVDEKKQLMEMKLEL